MISQPTTLVLGAGASSHLRYPLGRELINQLCALRRSSALDRLPPCWTKSSVEDFLNELSFSDAGSIDAFLERNPAHSDLGRFLIALVLKQFEDLEKMFPPKDAGWYRYLFESMLVNGKPEFYRNTLAIVTFNYDRSLEAYIHTRLKAQFRMTDLQATKTLQEVQIIRPHGILGEFPSVPYRNECSTPDLLAISQKIQIIHEVRNVPEHADGYANDAFSAGHDALIRARRIFFLGFGFHPDNMRRFRAFSPELLKGKKVFATMYGMSSLEADSLSEAMKPFGLPMREMRASSPYVSCDDFFRHIARLE